MVIFATQNVLTAYRKSSIATVPSSLAIYYGYPSLVNGANGYIPTAASIFSKYDVVVLGDGLEFTDRQSGREPPGDPIEHQRTVKLIAHVHNINPATQFYGYVCLGETSSASGNKLLLTQGELEDRIRQWRLTGVSGIFFDEAGYDFAGVTRERQNAAINYTHQLGLSAFMNAYFVEHLFDVARNLPYSTPEAKNPRGIKTSLGARDSFLLESFQVKDGEYDADATSRARVNHALEYRSRYGTRIFATTTGHSGKPFEQVKFDYAWWSAQLYGLDGFGWGEPNFAASTNLLPDRRCVVEESVLNELRRGFAVHTEAARLWMKTAHLVVNISLADHAVRISQLRRTPFDTRAFPPKDSFAPLGCRE